MFWIYWDTFWSLFFSAVFSSGQISPSALERRRAHQIGSVRSEVTNRARASKPEPDRQGIGHRENAPSAGLLH
jgi:hypothetical protein